MHSSSLSALCVRVRTHRDTNSSPGTWQVSCLREVTCFVFGFGSAASHETGHVSMLPAIYQLAEKHEKKNKKSFFFVKVRNMITTKFSALYYFHPPPPSPVQSPPLLYIYIYKQDSTNRSKRTAMSVLNVLKRCVIRRIIACRSGRLSEITVPSL